MSQTRKRVRQVKLKSIVPTDAGAGLTMAGIHRARNQIFPKRLLVTLPYATVVNLQRGVGEFSTYAEYGFNLNSGYDPDQSGVGHNVRGWDQWATLYQDYQVHSVKYDIQVYPASTSAVSAAANNLFVGLVIGPSGIATQYTTGNDLIEARSDPFCKIQFMTRSANGAGNSFTPIMNTYGTKPVNKGGRFTGRVFMRDIVKQWGLQDVTGTTQYTWPKDYFAKITTNPAALLQLVVIAFSGYEASYVTLPLPELYAIVRMEYDIEFQNPLQPGESLLDAATGVTGGLFPAGTTGTQSIQM